MNISGINDPFFLQAVEAIDTGNIPALENLINNHPRLVKDRLIAGNKGYFKDPYLLYFIADNPIRNGKLAPNIIDITRLLIKEVKTKSPGNFQQQIDYTRSLVATGRIPRESGFQLQIMDLLIDAGASPGNALSAIANGNKEAAAYIIKKGGQLNLPVAIGLEYNEEDILKLTAIASEEEKLVALTLAAFNGNTAMISFLLNNQFNPNGYPDPGFGFHSHATPLHQAVYSGSLDAVKLLVESGARFDVTDKIYNGTPLEWAEHMQTETKNEMMRKKYEEIERYLNDKC